RPAARPGRVHDGPGVGAGARRLRPAAPRLRPARRAGDQRRQRGIRAAHPRPVAAAAGRGGAALMANQPQREQPTKEAAGTGRALVRDYTLVTLVALVITSLMLYQEGLGIWVLIPATIAASAVLARWVAGPPLFLISLLVVTLLDAYLSGELW